MSTTYIFKEKQLKKLLEDAAELGATKALSKIPASRDNSPMLSARAVYKKYGHGKKSRDIVNKIGIRNGNIIKVDIMKFEEMYNNNRF